MKKNLFFTVLSCLLFLFSSCTNIISNNNTSFNINLDKKTSNEIQKTVVEHTTITKDDPISVMCTVQGKKVTKKALTKDTVLSAIDAINFQIEEIPLNTQFNIEILVSYKNIPLYEAKSSNYKITKYKNTLKLSLAKAEYKITYENDGNYADGATNPTSYNLESTPVRLKTPTRTGYTFQGWYTTTETEEIEVTTVGGNGSIGNITLHGRWTKDETPAPDPVPTPEEVTITYETGITQTVEQKTINHGSKLEAIHLPTNLTKDQFTFDNWKYKGGSKNGTVAQVGDTVTENITLEAVWIPFGTTADVVISGPDSNNVEKKGTTITLKCKTPGAQIYYTTDGNDPTTSLSPVSSPATITLKDAATVKAFATSNGNTQSSITTKEFVLKKYNVTFETIYGSVPTVQLTEGSKISEPSAPSQTGYTLKGWIKEKGTTPDLDILWNFSSDTMPGKDITLTAKWEINKYTITYTGTPESIQEKTVDYGTELADIHLPTNITKPENDFKEWKYKGGIMNGTVAKVGDTITENITLEAVWTPWTKLEDVTFSVSSGSVDAGDTITLSSVKGSTIYYTTDKSDPKTSETRTTVAPNDLGNTEKTITINEDTQIKTYSTAPKKLDSSIVTNDYTILKYTVTFDANGHGTAPGPIALPRGSDIPNEKLVPLTADGYKFIGWFKDNNTFNNEWTPSTDKVQASPITLYAKWEVPKETVREDGRIEVFALPINELKTYNFIAEKKYIINLDNALMTKTGATGELTTLIKTKTNIEELIIKNDVSTINTNAFKDCANLKTIDLPNTITTTGTDIFAGCTALTTINYAGAVAQWNAIQNINYSLPNNSTVTGSDFIKLPVMTDTDLLNYAYDGAKKYILHLDKAIMIAYNFGSSKQISNFVKRKNNIVGVIFGNDIQTLQSGCFDGCKSIEKITVGTQITDIPTYSFYGCSNLKNIELPANVTTISNSSFKNDPVITGVNIYYTGTIKQWGQIKAKADAARDTPGFNNATVLCSDGNTTANF